MIVHKEIYWNLPKNSEIVWILWIHRNISKPTKLQIKINWARNIIAKKEPKKE